MRRIMAKKVGGASGYDPDFQAWIDFNIAEGNYLVDTPKLNVINDFVVGAKEAGIWQRLDYIAWRAWNDLGMENASLIDLKGLVEATNNGAIYTEKGFEGDGSSAYIDLNFNVLTDGVNYTLDNAGKGGLAYIDRGTSGIAFYGLVSSSRLETLYNSDSGGHRMNTGSGSLAGGSVDLSGVGLISMYRDDDTNVRLYNKNVEFLRTQYSSSVEDENIVEFRRGANHSNPGNSMPFFGGSLTALQNEQLRTLANDALIGMGLTPYA